MKKQSYTITLNILKKDYLSQLKSCNELFLINGNINLLKFTE